MKQRQRFFYTVALMAIVAVGCMAFFGQEAYKRQQAALLKQSTLPVFKMKHWGQESFIYQADLITGKPVLVAYLDVSCHTCWQQGIELKRVQQLVPDLQMVVAMKGNNSEINSFISYASLSCAEGFYLADAENFQRFFGHTPSPTLLLYEPNGLLVNRMRGETSAEAIVKALGVRHLSANHDQY